MSDGRICPVCGASIGAVGDSLRDPLTEHFKAGDCAPESYRYDTLDIFGYYPIEILVVLEVLSRIPSLRHLWIRTRCPKTQRPNASWVDFLAQFLDQNTSIVVTRTDVVEPGLLSKMIGTRPGPQDIVVSQTDILNSTMRGNKTPAAVYSATITLPADRTLHHEALLEIPFELFTDKSRLVVTIPRADGLLSDVTQSLGLAYSLGRHNIFLSTRDLEEYVGQHGRAESRARRPFAAKVLGGASVEPIGSTPEDGHDPAASSPGAGAGTSLYRQSLALPATIDSITQTSQTIGCILDASGTDAVSFSLCLSANSECSDDRFSTHDVGNIFYRAPTDAPDDLLRSIASGGTPTQSSSHHRRAHMRTVSSGAIASVQTSPAAAEDQTGSVVGNGCRSAMLPMHDVEADTTSEPPHAPVTLQRQHRSFLRMIHGLGHASRADNGGVGAPEGSADAVTSTGATGATTHGGVLPKPGGSQSFSGIVDGIIDRIRGTADQHSRTGILLDAIQRMLGVVALRRRKSIVSREDLIPLLAVLLPCLESVDGVRITATFRESATRVIFARYSYPHQLILRTIMQHPRLGARPPTGAAGDRPSSQLTGSSHSSDSGGPTWYSYFDPRGILGYWGGGPAKQSETLLHYTRVRPSRMLVAFEGTCDPMRLGMNIRLPVDPLGAGHEAAKVGKALQFSRVTQPRLYSVYSLNEAPAQTMRFSTNAPTLPQGNSFLLSEKFGFPVLIKSNRFDSLLAVGTDTGDVFLVDHAQPFCESVEERVATLDATRGTWDVRLPHIAARLSRTDPVTGLEWLAPGVVAGATACGEVFAGTPAAVPVSVSAPAPSCDTVLDVGFPVRCTAMLGLGADRGRPLLACGSRFATVADVAAGTSVYEADVEAGAGAGVPARATSCRSMGSDVFALGLSSGRIVFYDRRAGAQPCASVASALRLPVTSMDFHPRAPLLLAGSLDSHVQLFDIRMDGAALSPQPSSLTHAARLPTMHSADNATSLHFTDGGKRVLVASSVSVCLQLLDFPSGKIFVEQYLHSPSDVTASRLLSSCVIHNQQFQFAALTKANQLCNIMVVDLAVDNSCTRGVARSMIGL